MIAPHLCTERLTLRPWTSTDLEALHRIWSDPEVIFWGPSESLEQTREVLGRFLDASSRPGLGWFAVCLHDEPLPVANAVLRPAPYREGELELGWHVARSAQRRGIATEAGQALVDHGFANFDVPRLSCIIMPDNTPSQGVARRLGFQKLGQLTYKTFLHDEYELIRPPRPGA